MGGRLTFICGPSVTSKGRQTGGVVPLGKKSVLVAHDKHYADMLSRRGILHVDTKRGSSQPALETLTSLGPVLSSLRG